MFLYRFEGVGFPLARIGHLVVDEEALLEIVEDSKHLDNIEEHCEWEAALQRIGARLTRAIFAEREFATDFAELIGKHKYAEICFDISRRIHPALLEALVQHSRGPTGRPGRKFWMLQAPVYRRLRNETGSERYPLFQEPEGLHDSINCLIIEAQVDGVAADIIDRKTQKEVSFKPLLNVPVEADWLYEYLNSNKEKFGLGQVERFNAIRVYPNSLASEVKRVLTQGTVKWHLVHYAGHCHYDPSARLGYLIFPGERLIETVDLGTFSTWLKDAQFVYLSGCRSSEEDFVFELANSYIPAVFGFRWKIDDLLAPSFTKSFYTNLFEKTYSLEYAFMNARRDMRDQFKAERIWAAPMLILQFSGTGTKPFFRRRLVLPPLRSKAAAAS